MTASIPPDLGVSTSPTGGQGTVFTCPLCGGRFTHAERTCSSCPMSAGCDVVACPHCGYQFPRTSFLVEAVRKLARRFGWLEER
jgi:hypothetical protein